MTLHRPKQMALEAYAQRRLSGAGKLRVERHLRACLACQQMLDTIFTYEDLRAEAVHEPAVELSWERLEQALDQAPSEGRTPARPAAPAAPKVSGKLIALAWPVLALAATFVFGYLALSERHAPEVARPSVPQTLPQPVAEAASHGWITLVAAGAELEIAGQRTPAQPGQLVPEGARILTRQGAEVHVALAGGSGIIVEAESEIEIARLREHSVQLNVRAGAVFQQVRKLAPDERYEVAFGPYVARVHGTRFQVAHGAHSSVSVTEGRVGVYQGDQMIADLNAGQNWSSEPSEPPAPNRDRKVHAAEPGSETWPTLALPPVANVIAWRVDDTTVSALGGLAMRMPAGDVTLKYEDARGRERALSLQVAPEGSALEEQHIRDLIAAQNDPRGHLDPEQIAPVVRAGLDSLRRCYERGLKRDPRLVGKLLLSIRVAPDGHVARATLDSGDGPALPLDVESCIQGEARSWMFPRPTGGFVVFEVPLNLKSSH
ncbi:MAG: AgmX/PglI C-terminal domain-containing protein [Myxococcales bacterium]